MAKQNEYKQAVQMRLEGKTYSQIKSKLNLSKSTLNRWLKHLPLSEDQLESVKLTNQIRIEKFRQTMKLKKDEKLLSYYREQQDQMLPLSNKELYIAGLFLYWGEGAKVNNNMLSINNTDPKVLQFILYWMVNTLNIPKKEIRVNLHLYADMDTKREIIYWSNILKISEHNFIKPYVKQTTQQSVNHKGHRHGTCTLMVYNTVLKEKILMAIKAVSDYYSEKVNQI